MNLLTFWAEGDWVTRFVAVALLAMSVSTWVVIFWRLNLLRRVKLDVPQSTAAFWQAAQFDEAHARVAQFDRDQSVTPLLEATLLPLAALWRPLVSVNINSPVSFATVCKPRSTGCNGANCCWLRWAQFHPLSAC